MNEKNQRKQGQELATRRILAIFLATALILWGMSYLYDIMTYGTTFLQGQKANQILLAVSGVVSVLCIGFYLIVRKAGKYRRDRVFNSAFFVFCAVSVFASSLIFEIDYYHGMHILNVLLPLVAVLILVYHIYERQFFTFCVAQAASIFAAVSYYMGLWECKFILIGAVILCLIPLILSLAKGGSMEKLVRVVLGSQFDRRYTAISYGATILLLAAAALVQGKLALIVGLGLGVYVLGSAVYYTVKAM